MPEITTPKPAAGFPDADKHNKEVSASLEAQGAAKAEPTAADLADTAGALDALAKDAFKPKDDDLPVIEPVAKPDLAAPKPGAPDPGKPAVGTPTPEDEATKKRADDLFKDSPTLAPNASPKSSEAFSAVKIKAAKEISLLEAERETLRKEKAELEEKLKNPVPPELEKELEDHRLWRAKLDVDSDPKFTEFDKTISVAHEFVYAQLRQSPAVTEDTISQIKKLGGPENVNLGKLFEAINDPVLQRIVESRVGEIAQTKWQKDLAIKSAKDNIQQYVAERSKAAEQSASAHNNATKQEFTKLVANLPWMKDKPVDSKAEPLVKAEAEEHNKFLADVKEQLQVALTDDSPQMRAIMLTGMAQLFQVQRNFAGLQAKHAATEKALQEATAKLDSYKSASVSRLRESGAPASGRTPEVKKDANLTQHPAEALDALRKQVVEERARVAAGA
jgi:hypothetical protein